MKTYAEVKAELRKETRESLKYFTKAFFATYQKALETIKQNEKNGVDDAYYDESAQVWTRHAWDDVRKTDFYNKTSCAYCSFLCIMCA